jgi:hypothetical protein
VFHRRLGGRRQAGPQFLLAAVPYLVLLATVSTAQTLLPPPVPSASKNLPLHSNLHAAQQLAASRAWTAVGLQADLAGQLPPGYFLAPVMAPDLVDVAGEGPAVINSCTYRDGGADGAGRTIDIIDGGFDGLTEAWNNGDIPSLYHWINYTDQPLESVTIHRTGCVEAAYDHCPGATFRPYMIDSITDLGPAVSDAITSGVNVISMSMSWKSTGWNDDSGDACYAVNWAALSGVIPVISAGNYARCHDQAAQWRDWGDVGFDQVYGRGGIYLYDFAPATLWIVRGDGNTGNVRYYPLYTVQAAHDLAIPDGRLLIFPGGSYPEPASLNRVLTVETTAYPAVPGE